MKFVKATTFGTLSLFACATSTLQASPTEQNTVKINAAFEFSSIDPFRSGYVFTRMQVSETLLNVDDQGSLIPGLATEWQILEQGKRCRLSLRDGVVFHNDTPMTAKCVAAVLKIAL